MTKYDPHNNNRKMSEQSRRDDYRNDDYRSSGYRHDDYRRRDYRSNDTRNGDYRRSGQGRYPDSRYYDRRGNDMRHRSSGAYGQPVKKKRHVGLFIILAIIIILLACVLYFGNKAKTQVNELKAQAYELKDELKETLDCVKTMDTDGAETALSKVDKTSNNINKTLNEPLWKFVTLIPGYGNDVTSVKTLMSALDDASNDLFKPFINQIRDNPLSELRATEKGLKISVILSYLDFLDKTEPKIHDIAEKISSVKFQKIDMDLEEYSEKFTGLFTSLDAIAEYKTLLRTFLGNGKDRLYLVMAQNSSEIRASGGFPGSMGVIRIKDGILSIGDFSSVTNFIHQPILPESNITERELQLYQGMYGNWAHDACYNPHFAKVAHITKVAYDHRNGESLDGILSMTPEIIQEILKITGDDITLEDGTKLDGTNATKVIQRDLYIKYQGDNATAYENNDYIDNLFAETAKKAMGLMFKSFDINNMPAYMNFIMDGCKKRTMMLWFANEEEEKISIDSGCSGNLNSDPKNPAAGVYFSCCDPGKLGMFVEINSTISEPKTNANGEQEYTVTVTLNDYINEENLTGVNSAYILGNNGGAIQSYVYFFAPAGGKVSDFETSNGMTIEMSEYEGLQVGYNLNLMLQPGEPVRVTYKVTTAKGVETPLRVESTPTLQDYK